MKKKKFLETYTVEEVAKGIKLANSNLKVIGFAGDGGTYGEGIEHLIFAAKGGDPDNGIKAGTSFKDLPDDWKCPECGAGKDSFEKIEE